MLDASAFDALAQLGPGLAAEAARQRPAEKPEDIFRAEVFHGVMQQAGIPAGERGVVTEDDSGGVLALSHAAVVSIDGSPIAAGPRIDVPSKPMIVATPKTKE